MKYTTKEIIKTFVAYANTGVKDYFEICEERVIGFVRHLGIEIEDPLKNCPLCNREVVIKDESQCIQDEIVDQWSIACECGLTLTKQDKDDLTDSWNNIVMEDE